jgi:hypothetical protein
MSYGDVELGVECALPPGIRLAPRRSRVRRLLDRLLGALVPRA